MLLDLFLPNSSPTHPDIFRCFRTNRGETFSFKKSSVYYFHRFFHENNPSILGCFPNSLCNSYHLQDLVFQPDALRPLIPALKKRQIKCLAVTVAVSGGRKRGRKVKKSRRFQFDDLDVLKWIHEMHWNACLGNEHQKKLRHVVIKNITYLYVVYIYTYAYVNIFDMYMFYTLFKVLSLPATRAKSEVFQQAINWDPQRFVTRSCRIIFCRIFVGGSSLMNMFCQICYLNLFDWWWPLTYGIRAGESNPTSWGPQR